MFTKLSKQEGITSRWHKCRRIACLILHNTALEFQSIDFFSSQFTLFLLFTKERPQQPRN